MSIDPVRKEVLMESFITAALKPDNIANEVIAAFTICLFFLQWRQHSHAKKLNRANYRLALFEKRMQTFFHIEEFFKEFNRDGKPSIEAAVRLRYNARTAHFLFPPHPLKFVDEIVTRSFEYYRAQLAWEPLRKRAWEGEQLTPEEVAAKKKHLEDMHEQQGWFHAQGEAERLQKEFAPYLLLPESV